MIQKYILLIKLKRQIVIGVTRKGLLVNDQTVQEMFEEICFQIRCLLERADQDSQLMR